MKLPESGRYQIRIIRSSDGRKLGREVDETEHGPTADTIANATASNYLYGVAIVDNLTKMVDLGDEIVPLSEITISEPS